MYRGNARRLSALLAGLLLLSVGCAAPNGQAGSDGTGSPPADGEEMNVYDCGDVQIGIPTEYVKQLIVTTEFDKTTADGMGESLISVSEKASVEAAKPDYPDGSAGFLFSIVRINQARYEQYLCQDHSGISAFARDNKGDYYTCRIPTDVQFYRGDGVIDTNSADWKSWEALQGIGDAVQADMINRNDLTAYSDEEFYSKPFTYDGNHAYVKYYEYFTFDGDKRMYCTLALSQPIKQGESGIWCVERMFDEFGNVYLYFPDTGISAAEYYAKLQQECDAGGSADLLTPLGAAKRYVPKSGYFNDTSVEESFAEADGLDTAYFTTNREVSDLVAKLVGGREVEDMELLACAGCFTKDTWGVLGRFSYGSDWWTPLRAALESAAVGEKQDVRDREMIRLYLTAHGQFEEAISKLLLTQREADADAFDRMTAEFTEAEQARIGAALGSARDKS